jgi:uncharacterized membrane protein HdeD (DUF308 family)
MEATLGGSAPSSYDKGDRPISFEGNRMPQKNIGMIVLAVYLILVGLVAVFSLNFANLAIILGLLALAAGILILLNR